MRGSGCGGIWLLFLVAILWRHLDAKLTLRVRLASGAIQRIEVEDENEVTVAGLRQRLKNAGALTDTDVSFVLKDKTYSGTTVGTGTGTGEDVTMHTLGIVNGEMLNIVGAPIATTTKDTCVKPASDTGMLVVYEQLY